MIAAAQALYVVSLLALVVLCAYVLRVRASRMRGLWYALGSWFTVPAVAIGAQLVDRYHPLAVLPQLLLLSAAWMVGCSLVAWAHVLRRVRGGLLAAPDVEALVEQRVAAVRRERTIWLADLALQRCAEIREMDAADAAK